jgi:hypothetical protein
MRARDRIVLLADAVIDIGLGLPLLFLSGELAALLGLPEPRPPFYASILGALLVGIGIAMIIECRGTRLRSGGLGLGGALTINVCGAVALAVWLARGTLELPLRGSILLWATVVIVGGLSVLELSLYSRREPRREEA